MSSDELKRQMLTQKLVRYVRAKHKLAKSTETDLKSESSKSSKKLNAERERGKECDSDLTKRAIEEIQRDTLKAAKLAEEIGPSGWRMKNKTTNKRFLANTMKSVLSHNERTKMKHAKESKRKFEELTKRPPKFGTRLHSFQSTDERQTKHKDPNAKS